MKEATVGNWMTVEPLAVTPSETLLAAHERMRKAHIRHLPVIDAWSSRQVIGLLTLGQIRQAELEVAAMYGGSELRPLVSQSKTVGELLTAVPITIAPDEPLAEAARLLLAHKLTALPVTNDDNQLLGIITESDIFGYLIEMQTPQW